MLSVKLTFNSVCCVFCLISITLKIMSREAEGESVTIRKSVYYDTPSSNVCQSVW